jgi:hypothetical protein
MVAYTATSVGSADSIARAFLQVELDKITDDPANNQSYVRLRARFGDNNASYGGTGTASWVVQLNGVEQGFGSFPYNLTGNSGAVYNFYDSYHWVTHSADGTKTITGFTEVAPFNSFIQTFNVSGPLALTDYNRFPTWSDQTISSSASVGTAYSDGVNATNAASYSVFSGALPGGLTLNTSTGAVTGTPTEPGVFNFVLRATGSFEGTIDTATQTITVLGGGKVWNGTAFVSGTTRVWNGTAFVSSTTKVWNGSSWESAK